MIDPAALMIFALLVMVAILAYRQQRMSDHIAAMDAELSRLGEVVEPSPSIE